MLRGLFPRFFSQFRESGMIHTKFVVSGTTTTVTFAPKSTRARSSYPGLTLVRTGVGLYECRLAGGAKEIAIGEIIVVPAAAGRRGLRFEPVGPVVEANASGISVIPLQSIDYTVGALADSITATDEVHVTLFVDK
jgi:hypothetical protein